MNKGMNACTDGRGVEDKRKRATEKSISRI